jgi:hypothetical protein
MITSAKVKKPNLHAIIEAFHYSYEIVRYHKNNILFKILNLEGWNYYAKPRRKLAYNDEIIYFIA